MRDGEKAINIVNMVNKLKIDNGTNDPFIICEKLNYKISDFNLNPNVYKAYTLENSHGEPCIYLNVNYSNKSKRILCAHELGHAILHEHNYYNCFGDSDPKKEYESDLFAVALLFNDDDFITPIHKLSSTELRYILDSNLKLLNKSTM